MSIQMKDLAPTEEGVRSSLAPPEAAREFINPVEDDTWVRHTQLVRMEELRAEVAEDGVAAKQRLLESYASTTRSTQDSLHGTKNDFDNTTSLLETYKLSEASEDRAKAMDYKQQMMANFRKKHPGTTTRTQ